MSHPTRPADGQQVSQRAAATRASILDAALLEFTAFGYRRSSMAGIAGRAGISRATLYLHWKSKEDLFRDLVESLHRKHEAAMEAVIEKGGRDLEEQLTGVLEARLLGFVELTSASPHAAELYDLHGRLCGDIARDSRDRSERILTGMLTDAELAGDLNLSRSGLDPADAAAVILDCAESAKGEDHAESTPGRFRERLSATVRLLAGGLRST